ncbi:hypothetical protein F4819DRAFT_510028 [Hypoxylon fuscum]|nr:hypothetical protein F4819DRAFT_510028 [Hypoxylon fuscum]
MAQRGDREFDPTTSLQYSSTPDEHLIAYNSETGLSQLTRLDPVNNELLLDSDTLVVHSDGMSQYAYDTGESRVCFDIYFGPVSPWNLVRFLDRFYSQADYLSKIEALFDALTIVQQILAVHPEIKKVKIKTPSSRIVRLFSVWIWKYVTRNGRTSNNLLVPYYQKMLTIHRDLIRLDNNGVHVQFWEYPSNKVPE